jgi:hypothetical protein
MGDKGSPCLRPLACLNFLPGSPLRMTLEEAVTRSVVIQSRHLWPNPSAFIVSMRNTQFNEPKALDISSLMKTEGLFDLCNLISDAPGTGSMKQSAPDTNSLFVWLVADG